MNVFAEVALPPGVVTENFPVVAPAGTDVVIWVALFTVNVALVPFNLTDVAPVKFVPVMIRGVATGPLVGLKLVMVGADTGTVTVKLPVELTLPPGVVTDTLPVVAPVGTAAVIWVALFTLNVAVFPLNAIAEAPVKFVPETTTDVPTGPVEGWSAEMVGAAGTLGDPEPEPLPPPHAVKAKINATSVTALKTC